MPRPRPPLWIVLASLAFLANYTLHLYNELDHPEPAGFAFDFDDKRMLLRFVLSDSAAARAGLQAGDRIVAVDGQRIRSIWDWYALRANLEIGRPAALEVERAGETLDLSLRFERRSWSRVGRVQQFVEAANAVGRLVMLALAFVIAWSRPRSGTALLGAFFLATVAIFQAAPPYSLGVLYRALPTPLAVFCLVPGLAAFTMPTAFFAFCASFPRPFFRGRWLWITALLPGVLLLPRVIEYALRIIYFPSQATGHLGDGTLHVATAIFSGYSLAAIAIVVANYRRLEQPSERRRLRVAVTGLVVGWSAALPWVALTIPGFVDTAVARFISSPLYFIVGNILFCLVFPLSFAHAILKHRLFDVRIIVRQGLRYAFARRLLVSLVPICGALLVADLLAHGDRPFLEILGQRGWIYVALGALASFAYARRTAWLDALDRRFFRERYDARQLLAGVVDEARRAGGIEAASPVVTARIYEALHPEFASVLVRDSDSSAFRTLSSAPPDATPPGLLAESKVVSLVRLLGKPLELSSAESGWLRQQLPSEESDILRRDRIELLVPVPAAGTGEALLALGPKRSEEPYVREDLELLAAIASSLALLLQHPAQTRVATTAESLATCPRCGACYDAGAARCSSDGEALEATGLPRLIGGRYRLEHRIGSGGMGTVYRATDTALERPVALKVIRDDRVVSAEAAERFRREARAAASFAHPNVVTVFDFGVVAATRAFLVMELLQGRSLRDTLAAEGRLDPARMLAIVRGVSAAIDAAHRRQLVHRDLKPENIFLARGEIGEIPKVLDFGIAKFLGAAAPAATTTETSPGTVIGTVRYMAPEQLRGQVPQPGWDVWALAVVAFEMLAGAHPFHAANVADFQVALLTGCATPLSKHLPAAPEELVKLFSRALSIDRSSRFGSAGELLAALERALRSSSGSAGC